MGDEDKNDYDRIAEKLEEAVNIILSAKVVFEMDGGLSRAVKIAAPILNQAERELLSLQQWVEGLAETYRS